MDCLHGIVVLDLTRRYPGGAYSAMLLADYGADVIKVDPIGGAKVRPPGREKLPEERFAAYWPFDRNKRSICVDLKKKEGRQVLERLVLRADVLIEGFRPGVMDRLGVGYSRLSSLNPRLIFCALSGFGQDGPDAEVAAHDKNFNALSGAASLVGERNGRPYAPPVLVADMGGAGAHGAIGVLLALCARDRTGKGQFVDVAYLDSVISLLSPIASRYFESGVVPKRVEDISSGGVVWSQVFRCKDDQYLTIEALEQHLWTNLCRALEREDLIPLHDVTGERAAQVVRELAAIFETRTRDEWDEYLKDKNACVAPVYDLDEALRTPQVIHRQMVVEVDHPKMGKVKQTGVPIKLSETPGSIRRLGVPTGTDSDAVMRELGFGDQEIGALRQLGALG